jgi:hypothetical protein
VTKGDRVAQLILEKISTLPVEVVEVCPSFFSQTHGRIWTKLAEAKGPLVQLGHPDDISDQ